MCPVSHLNNSLMVYLHLLQPLCQCLNLCDRGAEWWCVTHSWWKITAALRSAQRLMKNHWLLLVPNKRMWWKSQRLRERKRDSEGGAEECKTRPHPSHKLRRHIPVPLARGYIHSKSQWRGNLGEAGGGGASIHNLTLGLSVRTNSMPLPVALSSLCGHDKCTFCCWWMCRFSKQQPKSQTTAWMLIVKMSNSASLPPPSISNLPSLISQCCIRAGVVAYLGWDGGDFRVEGAGDGFLECTHLHSSLSLLSSVKRWERWGAASSHSCVLHLLGVRGSIVNSDLVPSTMPNYWQYHVIYTSSYIKDGLRT